MDKWPKYYHEKMETMDPEKLRSLQENKLRKQLNYVWKNSPFYQKKFKASGISPKDFKRLEDLKKFPFTTKEGEAGTQALRGVRASRIHLLFSRMGFPELSRIASMGHLIKIVLLCFRRCEKIR